MTSMHFDPSEHSLEYYAENAELEKNDSILSTNVHQYKANITEAMEMGKGNAGAASTSKPYRREGPLPPKLQEMLQKKRKLRRLWQRTRCPRIKTELNKLAEKLSNAIKALDYEDGRRWEIIAFFENDTEQANIGGYFVEDLVKVPTERPASTEKAEEIRPRTREWEKHKAPWMEELKLNQAKKTSFGSEGKSRSVSTSSEASGVASKAGGGSTDRILECGLEEKRSSHLMEMSKSTSSISNRISVLENLESSLEAKTRQSVDPKNPPERPPDLPTSKPPPLQSPTAAGRTLTAMLEDIKKPPAPSPPTAFTRTTSEIDKSPNKPDKLTPIDKHEVSSIAKFSSSIIEKSSSSVEERKVEEKSMSSGTLERRLHSLKAEKPAELPDRGSDALIAQLNNRIFNLEKLIEVQNAKFNAAIEDLTDKLKQESEKRHALQLEMQKLAHCVTQV